MQNNKPTRILRNAKLGLAGLALFSLPYITGCENDDRTEVKEGLGAAQTTSEYAEIVQVEAEADDSYIAESEDNSEGQTLGSNRKKGKKATVSAGGGTFRSNASGGIARHFSAGGSASYAVKLTPNKAYTVSAGYSNDDTGAGDLIAFYLNGSEIGRFTTQSTGSGGNGWNNFIRSPEISFTTGDSRKNRLEVKVLRDDGWGVELDNFYFLPVR